MTVTGVLSADVASAAYTPPFKYVTSYAPKPEVTGTVTSALPMNPTVTGSSDAAFATAYLQAHMMSWPSYRYAYLMWLVFAVLAALYALCHHLRLSGGSLGASFVKWGVRRRPFGSKRNGGARGRALPSNSVLLSVSILAIVPCVLSVIGADYITPSSSVLNFASSFRKRASIGYTINKAWWTSGSRFGFIAFAMIPLVTLFALKASPVAVFALRPFTHIFSDKLAIFHKTAAWLVWIFTSLHVALWTVQLFQDQRNGKAVWFYIWDSYRFIFGCVAYGMMTAVMVLSLKPVRKGSYEFFYYAHVVTVLLTIVCSAVHHPVLWFWMAAALALWGAERLHRLVRLAKINGFFGKARAHTPLVAGQPYRDATQSYGMQNLKVASDNGNPFSDKMLSAGTGGPTREYNDFGPANSYGYYDEGSLQPLGSYESRYAQLGQGPPVAMPKSESHLTMPRSTSVGKMPDSTRIRPSLVPAPIPVGHAQAQLLPSRTIRLTINVAHTFRWAAGQSVLLYLPELSRFQSHPFTITNNDPSEIVLLIKARKGITRRLFELVKQRSLASAGHRDVNGQRFSQASLRTAAANPHFQMPPIYVKAWVDGPMGSAARVKWAEYSSTLIICGGSGVSFGAAICEKLCRQMQCGGGKTRRVRFCWVVREYAEIAWIAGQLRRCQDMVSPGQLQIDIFVTNANKIHNDFAPPRPGFAQGGQHLRRGSADSLASEMSVDSTMDINEDIDPQMDSNYADIIDLTNYEDEEDVNDPAENHLSATLQKEGKVRRARSRKAAKQRSRASNQTASYPPSRHTPVHDNGQRHNQGRDSLHSTPFRDPRNSECSESRPIASAYNDLLPRTQSSLGYDQALSHLSAHSPSEHDPLSPPSMPFYSPSDRRHSYQSSVADVTFGGYDPFGGPGIAPSPSPSMFFDDAASTTGESMRDIISRTSRTQSMVLLEDYGSDPTGDTGLWVDEADHAAMSILSEMARPGKPKLSVVIEEELVAASGSMIVTTCGPVTLNTVVRNLVSKHVSPAKIRRGDRTGQVVVYSEDYET